MPLHEPEGYVCPFCAMIRGTPGVAPLREDMVAEDERAIAVIAARWWPNNPGHVLVLPRAHSENLYSIPAADLHAVIDLVQHVAVAVRVEYGCSGTSVRQHNESDGGQDVWHFHMHVFPRYPGDDLNTTAPLPGFAAAQERARFSRRLRPLLSGGAER